MEDAAPFFIGAAVLAALITHLWVTISSQAWILLLVGVMLPPLGVVHGIVVWVGGTWV